MTRKALLVATIVVTCAVLGGLWSQLSAAPTEESSPKSAVVAVQPPAFDQHLRLPGPLTRDRSESLVPIVALGFAAATLLVTLAVLLRGRRAWMSSPSVVLPAAVSVGTYEVGHVDRDPTPSGDRVFSAD